LACSHRHRAGRQSARCEADWWYDQRERLTEEFLGAAKEGRLKRGSTVLERIRARQPGSSLTVPLSEEEIARIHELAERAGQDDATFAAWLIHRALENADRR
jgi:hypothetical protein